jgi:hypothetical protein
VPLVLNGEREEILVYFPEIRSAFEAVEEKLQIAWVALKQIWQDNREIVGQKEFALAILGKTPFTGMLFQVRKQDKDSQSVEHLREIWQASADIIVKVLFVI